MDAPIEKRINVKLKNGMSCLSFLSVITFLMVTFLPLAQARFPFGFWRHKQRPSPYGYVVLTNSTFDGNLGGLAGANNLCLNEVKNTNWKGKSAGSTLDSSTVRAWLCDSSTCQNFTPGFVYKFARSGAVTAGGGLLAVDNTGRAPYDEVKWSIASTFQLSQNFWTGRGRYRQTVEGRVWESQVSPPVPVSGSQSCSDWSASAGSGNIGMSDYTNGYRWGGSTLSCATLNRLVCIVDPSSPFDRTPSLPTFTDIIDVEPGSVQTTSGAVTGIDAPVMAIVQTEDILNPTATNAAWAAQVRNITTSSGWATNILVNPGDTIELKAAALPYLGTELAIRVSIGTLQTIWKVTTRAPNPEVRVGYAMAADTTNGNIGGLSGANQACLNQANNKVWLGKGTVKLSSSNVKAFLCDDTTCNNPSANTKYFFGNLGLTSFGMAGGAYFYMDASGNGPNQDGIWGSMNTVSYWPFWGSNEIWTGRAVGSALQWPNGPSGSSCANWGTTSGSGTYGTTEEVGTSRWSKGTQLCTSSRKFLCLIQPPSTGFGFADIRTALVNTQYTESFTFTALTAPISASVSGSGAEIRKNSGSWGAAIASLDNGDTISVRMTSAVVGHAAKVAVIQAGDATVEWIVRTKDDAATTEQMITGTTNYTGGLMARYQNTMAVVQGTGTVVIYGFSGSTWSSLATIVDGETSQIDRIAMDDNTIVLGHRNAKDGTLNGAGSISIIEKGTSWSDVTQTIKYSPDSSAYGYFGTATAVSGDTVVASNEKGKLYIYQKTGSGWDSATVVTRTLSKYLYYTSSKTIALVGNTMVVGTHPVNSTGQIEVIEKTGANWDTANVTYLSSPDVSMNDNFGKVVAISADESTIVASAPAKNRTLFPAGYGWEHGGAYIFEKGATWGSATVVSLDVPVIKPAEHFGTSVAIQGNIIAIGADQAHGEGAVYMYKKTTTWAAAASDPTVVMKHMTASNPGQRFDNFGQGVSLCGDWLVAGAPYSSHTAKNRGLIYSYKISGLTGGVSCP